jgi:hypothetical protein
MTVDKYFAWADGQAGRYELVKRTVHALPPAGSGVEA